MSYSYCSYRRQILTDDCWMVGDVATKVDLTPDEQQKLCAYYQDNTITNVQIFKRLYKDRQTFYSAHYTRVKKRNSFTITYGPGEQIGQVQYFAIFRGKPAAVIRKVSRQEGSSNLAPIIAVELTLELAIVDITQIREKVIFMSTSPSTAYIAWFPSKLNLD